MYLKKIEVQGFKSFANKTVLEFTPGIMGIVGPNGSGKSNVADAVRWVLGEQSAKQLRGTSMQDVIFAGTQSRKAQGYASVALTIDNADHQLGKDFSEVVVCRRVYRSGESEYLLNGETCRLRDISELFYDTGVGREGYSIIGQGQVEKVLSGRPEDRRELFDEAAGIIKYRKRKSAAVKKLDDEEKNLVRISDILGELERQVGPLTKQAEQARCYLKLRDELRELEVGAFCLESEDMRSRLRDITEKLKTAEDELAENRRRVQEAAELYDQKEEEGRRLEEQIAGGRGEESLIRVEQEKREGRVRLLEEQVRAAERDDRETAERIHALDEAAAAAQKEAETVRRTQEELAGEIREKEEFLSSCTDELEKTEEELRQKEGEQARENDARIRLLEEKSRIAAQRERSRTLIEQAAGREEESREAVRGFAEEEEQLAGKKRQQQQGLDHLRRQIGETDAALKKAQEKLAENRTEKTDLYDKLDRTRKDYHSGQSRLETLQNLSERYEGYGNSVRRIMEKKKTEPGIYGVVADLFHVDKKYETAIETALGGRLQNIVTDSRRTALRFVDYLKKEKLGRATFLPLASITVKDGFPEPDALQEEGAIGLASSLVETEDRIRPVAELLLGRVLVADNAENAGKIADKYHHSIAIVTLEGEHFAPGGPLTGGAYRSSSNLLGRRREIEELKKEVEALQLAIEEMQSGIIENAARKVEISRLCDDLQQKLQELRVKEAALAEMLRQLESRSEELSRNRELYLEETKSLQERVEESRRLDEELTRQEEEKAALLAEKTAGLERLAEALTDCRREREEKERRVSELHSDLSALREKERHLRDELFRLGREKDRAREERENILRSRSVRESAEEKEAEIRQVKEEIASAAQTLEQMTAGLARQQEQREALAGQAREALDLRMSLTEETGRLDKEVYRLESQKERWDSQLEQLVEYLWSEYEMTPSEAEKVSFEGERSLREIRRSIASRKNDIRELGPVNVNAIEESKEVLERYEFLKTQHEDLTRAREELLEIIRGLDSAMRRQFREIFELIRLEFDKVFRELFGGGQGTLELTEAESGDLLDAGIAIIAQPPGKKLQNMMQLSGGEKALTAIALLFAIQNLKPSPFCLLDEIEAALDEPNVGRYADYLSKLKQQTQFIVITHRRGTMEMADRLYGVTMQEKGISTLVSVDLTDDTLTS